MPSPLKKIKQAKHSFQYSPCKKAFLSASLTVECALILPFVFLMLITLITVMNAFSIQAETSLTLSGKIRKNAAAAYIIQTDSFDQPLILTQTDTLDFPLSPLPLPSLKIRIYVRAYPWIGASKDFIDTWRSADSNDMVFISDNREVYHLYSNCSFINITVIETTSALVDTLRNNNGMRYKKAPGFPNDYAGPVYITPEGQYYYATPEAAPLIRHVHLVSSAQVSHLPLCTRCAARNQNK